MRVLWTSQYSRNCHWPGYLSYANQFRVPPFLLPSAIPIRCCKLPQNTLSSCNSLIPKPIRSVPELMREKRLVTFLMAPRKSSGQGTGKEATMADGWKKSKLSESEISSLVSRHMLQPREIIQWQSVEGHSRPYEKVAETVVQVLCRTWSCNFNLRFSAGFIVPLENPAPSLGPKFHPPYFNFCASVRSFPWNPSPFRSFQESLLLEPPSEW